MNDSTHDLSYGVSAEEAEAQFDASLAIVDEVEAGRLSREQAMDQLIAMGGTPSSAAKFLRHTLDQAKLDAEYKCTGRLSD